MIFMDEKRSLLIIAYYFPPAGGAGVQRTLKFTKYLPEFGWNPVLLTVTPQAHHLQDDTLLAEIPPQTPIYTAPALLLPHKLPWKLRHFLSRWFLLVDEQIGWYVPALKRAKELLQMHHIRVIYSTSSPYTDHLIALSLKHSSNLPWLADFRDPWYGNFARQYPSRLHRHLDQHLEKKVVQSADKIIVVSEPMRSNLLSRYPDLNDGKVVPIPNGYDPMDFTHCQPVQIPDDRMVIVYAGSFYARELTPKNFLYALASSINSGAIPRNQIQVYFVGNIGGHSSRYINETSLTDVVKLTGYLAHKDSISYLLNADVLLLIIGASPGSEVVLTGKIFEYLAARKPILALAPDGAAARLINHANAGLVVNPEDVQAISSALTDLYLRWKRGELVSKSIASVVEKYDRRILTSILAKQLDQISFPSGQM